MSKTIRETFIAGLTARGERFVKHLHKYEVYTCATGGYFYVGRSGALRMGDTITSSVPAPTRLKMAVELAALTVPAFRR